MNKGKYKRKGITGKSRVSDFIAQTSKLFNIFLFHISPHTQPGKIIESVDQTQGARFLFPLNTGKRIKSEG